MPGKKQKDDAAEADAKTRNGIFMFPNGDKYEGEYRQLPGGVLERCGSGVHTTADGSIFSGVWVNDRLNESGRIQFASGACYEGGISDNRFHGYGRYCWPNGSYFEGEFSENKIEGNGQFTDTEGQVWNGLFCHRKAPGLRFQLKM